MENRMMFEFDIDNTLVTQGTPGEYQTCTPIDGAVERVNKLHDLGHVIVLHTARHWMHFDITYNQMKKFGFKFHSLLMGKVNADVIIDDRAVSSVYDLSVDLFKKAYKLCLVCDKECDVQEKKGQDLAVLEKEWDF